MESEKEEHDAKKHGKKKRLMKKGRNENKMEKRRES